MTEEKNESFEGICPTCHQPYLKRTQKLFSRLYLAALHPDWDYWVSSKDERAMDLLKEVEAELSRITGKKIDLTRIRHEL